MSFKVPRSIRMLSAYGADALRPSLYKGRYIAPLVSKRIAADLRKRAIIEGTFGDFVPDLGKQAYKHIRSLASAIWNSRSNTWSPAICKTQNIITL
jgi:hypothetical protein